VLLIQTAAEDDQLGAQRNLPATWTITVPLGLHRQ